MARIANMEVLLHESSTIHGNGTSTVVPEERSDTNGVSDNSTVNGSNVKGEKLHGQDVSFRMLPQQEPADIQFEKITFTATEGGLFKKKSKYLYSSLLFDCFEGD